MALVDEFDYSIKTLLIKGFLLILDILVFSYLTFVLWNYLAPIIGLVKIDYKAAVAVFLLSRFLLKDHLLSSEPTIVHCPCQGEEIETKVEEAQ